jgi:hypothetical protein
MPPKNSNDPPAESSYSYVPTGAIGEAFPSGRGTCPMGRGALVPHRRLYCKNKLTYTWGL